MSSIIGSYKSAVTKNANRLGFDHAWQSRFHDHIIRSDDEYQRIVNYINTNPENWDQDIFLIRGIMSKPDGMERIAQTRVVKLFQDELNYRYLGNLEKKETTTMWMKHC